MKTYAQVILSMLEDITDLTVAFSGGDTSPVPEQPSAHHIMAGTETAHQKMRSPLGKQRNLVKPMPKIDDMHDTGGIPTE